jgi:hypothetical protein
LPVHMLDQFSPDREVEWQRLAGTELIEPLFADVIGKLPEAEHRNVDRVSFAGRLVFGKIPLTSRTPMVDDRFTCLDFDSTPVGARPFVAAPRIAVHGKISCGRDRRGVDIRIRSSATDGLRQEDSKHGDRVL